MSMDKAQFTDFQIKRMAEAIADTSEGCPAIIASLKAALQAASQSKADGVQQDNEWFYRWAARAMADGKYKEAIGVIFHHPDNPYAKNNPWETNMDAAQKADAGEGG